MKSFAQHSDLLVAAVMADIAIVLLAGAVLSRAARYLRQPPVIGEIVAGIALGPSLLGLLPGDLPDRLFPLEARPYLNAVAQVGLLVFMFGIGWEFDKRLLQGRRSTAGAVSLARSRWRSHSAPGSRRCCTTGIPRSRVTTSRSPRSRCSSARRCRSRRSRCWPEC